MLLSICIPRCRINTARTTRSSTNDSITIQTVNNYNEIHNCPQFAYNGTNPITGLPYATGSSAGVSQTEAGTVLFGGTDVPPSASLVYPTGDLLNFPIVVAAVAVIYNLPMQTTPLNLSAAQIAGIFSGKYLTWGAVGASNLNPVYATTAITIVVRGDSSGSTGDLNEYLSTYPGLTPAWTQTGNGSSSTTGFSAAQWQAAWTGLPTVNSTYVFATGTGAMLSDVNGTTGAVGYAGFNNVVVEALADVDVAAVQNPSGAFIVPSVASIEAAIVGITVPKNLLIDSINSTNATAYPIATPTNIVVRDCQVSCCQAIELRKFLYYYATVAQGNAEPNGFGKLSSAIVQQYVKNLNLINSSEGCVSDKVKQCCVATGSW